MTSTGPEAAAAGLRELRDDLAELRAGPCTHGFSPLLDRILDRLGRDLLPRTAGEHNHLVAGIVGPNNAGKSALFNSLVAGPLETGSEAPPAISPSLPTGGATRRLVGALSPELRAVLEAEPTLQRFPMRSVVPGSGGVEIATETAAEDAVAELLLVETEFLPESLLLVDTPDFDSVLVENRAVTDALLAVADLAVVVVTRHTYQNRDVIDFLRGWLGEGRPWILVYNESIDEGTTLQHAAKIEADLDGKAEAIFHAEFDVGVARGERALVPTLLEGASGPGNLGAGAGSVPGGDVPLGAWLRELGASGDLKARALAASLAGLDGDLRDLASGARTHRAAVDAVEEIMGAHGTRLGEAVAREAMPMGPFLEAFREVLDERPTAVQRELRRGLRWTGSQVVGTARWIKGKVRGGTDAVGGDPALSRATSLAAAERKGLEERWAGFIEPLLLELRQLRRDPGTPPEVQAALKDLTETAAAREGLEHAGAALDLDPELMSEYHGACREIIAAELDRRGTEWALQLAVDGLHLLPIGVAGAMIVHTGGMGADLAMAGGGALSAAAAERLSRALGTGVALAARRRWVELRTPKIRGAVMAGLWGPAAPEAPEGSKALPVPESLGLGDLRCAYDRLARAAVRRG